MKEGDTVVLDNIIEVTLIKIGIVKNDKVIKDFSTIRQSKLGQWNVANFRLSSKLDETLLQGDDQGRQVQA
jgi:hypothetical protein